MRLTSLKDFRALVYAPGSAPTMATLRAQIRAGRIPGGRIIAGHFFVDLDEFDRATNLSEELHARRRQLMKSPVLQGLI